MGWFSKTRTCDWCGAAFKTGGVEWEGLLFCGADCRDAHASPPAPTPTPVPTPQRRERTLDDVRSDLRLAKGQIKSYRAQVMGAEASISVQGLQNAVVASDVAYVEAWRHLTDAGRAVGALGADTTRFDRLRDFGFGAHHTYKLKRETRLTAGVGGVGLQETVTARLDVPTSQRLFRAALAELMSLADQLARRAGERPVFGITPDEADMSELLGRCEAEQRRQAARPDLFKILEGS